MIRIQSNMIQWSTQTSSGQGDLIFNSRYAKKRHTEMIVVEKKALSTILKVLIKRSVGLSWIISDAFQISRFSGTPSVIKSITKE